VLLGRRRECAELDRLIAAVRAGESRALVVRGEAGVGKSALLDRMTKSAIGCRVLRAAGVESEMEIAFAGLHQLCASILELRSRLPDAQREALATTFGLGESGSPDRFLVGLAALGLLSEAAREQPLICVVDDAQWLDEASAQALTFVARRLSMESVGLVFALRAARPDGALTGPPELLVEGLSKADGRALLSMAIQAPLDPRVADRIVADTGGNPLALLELPRGMSPVELAGGFGISDPRTLSGRIEESFLRRLGALGAESRQLLLLVAAEPLGDPSLVRRGAERLGISFRSARDIEAAGLCEFGPTVRFRHPLVRSAVYGAAAPEERHAAHQALAEVTDPAVDPDRRAWHRAQAVAGTDEDVAAELERSADRARARGGIAAAAAFLERAADLSPESASRAARALAAAQAKLQAGAPDAALRLLARAEIGPLDDLRRARALRVRAQVAFASGGDDDAAALLVDAARRLEPLDLDLARETYLDALCATIFAGPSPGGPGQLDVARAALPATQAAQPPDAVGLLLEGMTLQVTSGLPAAVPTLRRALKAFDRDDLSRVEGLGWGWLASHVASTIWEDNLQYVLSTRHIQLARDAGALVVLPLTLQQLAGIRMRNGELDAAAAVIEEMDTATAATGVAQAPFVVLALAAYRGREAEVKALIEAGSAQQPFRGIGALVVQWALALLYNGLGRYPEALAAAQLAYEDPQPIDNSAWTLHELIEAAAASGRPEAAAEAMRRLSEMAAASGTDWALGIEARSRALLSDAAVAEGLYREAIERLGLPSTRVEHARSHLVLGEWLLGQHRHGEAREALHTAHERFAKMGVEAFAGRSARGLQAIGEIALQPAAAARDALTAEQAQIARLSGEGLSSAEIATRLFVSPRTVEHRLEQIRAKLTLDERDSG
jgi:DNA-binding CsgD family transcriptional regulator